MPDEHAKLSPSAYGRWSRCPGSIELTRALPDSTSEAAQWGTDAHAILEGMLNEYFNFVTHEGPDMGDYDEKAEVALVAYQYVIEQYGKSHKAGLHPQVGIEQKVYPEPYTNEPDLWGSADIILMDDTCVEVIDLKAGAGVLVMPTSGQLKIYALGALAALDPYKLPKWVKMTIVQPRIEHPDGVIRSDLMKTSELFDWCNDKLIPAIEAVNADNPALVAGTEQCKFCQAKSTCPEIASTNEKLAMSTFIDQTKKDLRDIAEVDINCLTLEKVAEIIEAAPMIRSWLTAVEERAVDELRNGNRIPGYKAVRTGKRNTWSLPPEEIVERLATVIPPENLVKEVVLTAPQALKIKGLTSEQRAAVQQYVVKSEGSLKVVSESNREPDAFPELPFRDTTFLD